MNKQRRKRLEDLLKDIELLKTDLEDISSEEEEAFSNIPENLQNSDRYYDCENAVTSLSDAVYDIENCISNIESAME